ncbi:MAG: AAA family ATPase [Henriciella sp.]|nr:AAA family ATPase [Henriciella sp.]
MQVIFIYGPPAAGKLTVAKIVAEATGFALFHNHLIVDAVASIFPFGSENFVRLREKFWIETMEAAASEDRSFIFTYLPENSVRPDFPSRVQDLVEAVGGKITFVHLTLSQDGQLDRIANADRAEFGKLRDIEILRANFDQFESAARDMPPADVVIDTEVTSAKNAAKLITSKLNEIAPG